MCDSPRLLKRPLRTGKTEVARRPEHLQKPKRPEGSLARRTDFQLSPLRLESNEAARSGQPRSSLLQLTC